MSTSPPPHLIPSSLVWMGDRDPPAGLGGGMEVREAALQIWEGGGGGISGLRCSGFSGQWGPGKHAKVTPGTRPQTPHPALFPGLMRSSPDTSSAMCPGPLHPLLR